MLIKLIPAMALAACAVGGGPAVGPMESEFPPIAPNEKEVLIQAEADGARVAASCSVGGPAMDVRFTTPATISIPFANGQAMTTVIDCRYNGQRLSTQTPPNEQTSSITVDFTNPRSEFWFKRGNGGVLYYTRGDVVVSVSGTP